MAFTVKQILGALPMAGGDGLLFQCSKEDGSQATLAIPAHSIGYVIEMLGSYLAKVHRGQIIGEARDVPAFDVHQCEIGPSQQSGAVLLSMIFGAADLGARLTFHLDSDTAIEMNASLAKTLGSISSQKNQKPN